MSDKRKEQVDVRAGTMSRFTFTVLRQMLYGLAKVLARIDVQGAGNVPREGGCIVVANHLHNLDPLLISIACPRPVHYMAKIELMRIPVLGRFLRWGGAFPVNRGKMDLASIRHAQAVLQQGVALGMFPEGTRSPTMKIESVHSGAGLLAIGHKVPIVPATITGSERLPFNGAKQQRRGAAMPDPGHTGVRVTFGAPFMIPDEIDGKRPNAAAAVDYMMQRVAAMLPVDYRGIYGPKQSQIIELDEA